MNKSDPMNFYWYGKHITELSREELLELVAHLVAEKGQLKTDRDRWMQAGDAAKYLLNK